MPATEEWDESLQVLTEKLAAMPDQMTTKSLTDCPVRGKFIKYAVGFGGGGGRLVGSRPCFLTPLLTHRFQKPMDFVPQGGVKNDQLVKALYQHPAMQKLTTFVESRFFIHSG